MNHHTGHEHHHHAPDSFDRAFAVGAALNLIYIVIEVGIGWSVGSLALLADAGHNLSDVFSLLLAWGAAYLARRPPSVYRTYGMRRASILAALANAVILLIAVGAIAWEAIHRVAEPQPVPGLPVMIVAGVGTIINAATALLFMKGRRHDLNLRGAYLHMAADAGVSLGVVVAGLVIQLTGFLWIDPATSLAIVVVVTIGTWGLLRDSVDLALDAVPKGIDPEKVRDYLAGLPGIAAVHDLHIWGMSTTHSALTAHLVKPDGRIDDVLLARLSGQLRDKFGIEHVTVQFESRGDDVCGQSSANVV